MSPISLFLSILPSPFLSVRPPPSLSSLYLSLSLSLSSFPLSPPLHFLLFISPPPPQDLLAILPIVDSVMLLELTGAQFLEALENGVSQYPKHEGRFPQVSGTSFTFDPTQPSGHRIAEDSVSVGGASLVEDKLYKLCTKGYIGKQGKDGYEVFRDCKQLVPEDEGPILFSMVRDYFEKCLKLSQENDQVDGG